MISVTITKIPPIKSTLNLSMDYIAKIERILVPSFKCHPYIDHIQFMKTREVNDINGSFLSGILIQSFILGQFCAIKRL